MKSYDLVSIGNYTKDTIVSKAGVRHVDGGGYSYAAHAAHLRGLAVAAVTRLAAGDRKSTQALVDKGVDVYVIESPQSTLMRLEYPTDNVDERILTVESVADAFTPELLADFAAQSFVVNGSARGEASLEVLQSLKARCERLCADVQGFIRVVGRDGRLRYEPWPEQGAILGLIDILKTDAVEAEFLTGETDIHRAAQQARRLRAARGRADASRRPAGAGRRQIPRGGLSSRSAARPERSRRHLHGLLRRGTPRPGPGRRDDLGGGGDQPEDGTGRPDHAQRKGREGADPCEVRQRRRRGMSRLAQIGLPLAAAALAACVSGPDSVQGTAVDAQSAAQSGETATSILLIGDTGYDYDWLEQDDYEDRFTGREFIVNELDDWIEDKLPIAEFRLPPMHFAEQTGGWVMASGMWPVAKAVATWCSSSARCDFGVMLGDNIYPSGATFGADGRDDAERFRELLWDAVQGPAGTGPRVRPLCRARQPRLGDLARRRDAAGRLHGGIAALSHGRRSLPRPPGRRDVELFAVDTTVLLAGQTVYKDALDDAGIPQASSELEPEVAWAAPEGDERDMLAWLERSLRESDARWKIVMGHHPLWSSSGTKVEEEIALRRILRPVLCRYADAYLAGHDHMLEVHTDDCRGEVPADADMPPLLHIVSGAAGKQRPEHSAFMAWQDRTYPEKRSLYVRSLVWGFGELVLARRRSASPDAHDAQRRLGRRRSRVRPGVRAPLARARRHSRMIARW